jgi:hypothetical protein
MSVDIPDEAWAAAGEAVLRSEAIEAAAPIIARAAQVAILRELLGADDPNFRRKSARDLVLSFMNKLSELEAGANQAEVRDED